MMSAYFRVKVVRKKTMFFSAEIRSFDQLSLDRAIDKKHGIFECYVSEGQADFFASLLESMRIRGIVEWFERGEPRMPVRFH